MNLSTADSLCQLAKLETEKAVGVISRIQKAEIEARNKLAMLEHYRAQYLAERNPPNSGGLTTVAWRNYDAFLRRLELAIDEQRRICAAWQERKQAGQQKWLEAQQREQAFDALRRQALKTAQIQATRREQKHTDEVARRIATRNPIDHQETP